MLRGKLAALKLRLDWGLITAQEYNQGLNSLCTEYGTEYVAETIMDMVGRR